MDISRQPSHKSNSSFSIKRDNQNMNLCRSQYHAAMPKEEEEVFNADVLVKYKKVLVTGAGSGLGKATAVQLCRLGASVYVTDLQNANPQLEKIVADCRRHEGKGSVYGSAVVTNMADIGQAEKIVKQGIEKLKGLDYLVLTHANKGHSQRKLYGYTPADLTRLKKNFDINFFSYVAMTSAAMPALRKSGGKVAVVSSIYGRRADIFAPMFVPTKHAVEGFFKSLDLENYFMDTNVSFTIIIPGFFEPPKPKPEEDTEEKVESQMKKGMEKHGLDINKWRSLLNVTADIKTSAAAVIKATALRKVEVYLPDDYNVWWPVLKTHLFPVWLRNTIKTFRIID